MIKAFIHDPRCLTLKLRPLLDVYCQNNIRVQDPELGKEERLNCDIYILYQDYLGLGKFYTDEAIEAGIPVLVIQHGRHATRDYSKKEFNLIANKICLWGYYDYRRMRGLGYPEDKLVITGCPLLEDIGEKYNTAAISDRRVIFFTPKYAPYLYGENFEVLKVLLKTDCDILIKTLSDDVNINGYNTYIQKYFPRIKLLSTSPISEDHLPKLIEGLKMSNYLVGIEESVIELMAEALDMPVICVNDVYRVNKEGLHFNGSHDVLKKGLFYSDAAYQTKLVDLFDTICEATNQDTLKGERGFEVLNCGGFGFRTSALIIREVEKLIDEKKVQASA